MVDPIDQLTENPIFRRESFRQFKDTHRCLHSSLIYAQIVIALNVRHGVETQCWSKISPSPFLPVGLAQGIEALCERAAAAGEHRRVPQGE
jgi:hypothetical protein